MKVAHLSEPAEERVIFRDGLGVRERRETGTGEVVEWCHFDPAFASVESTLRDRVTRLSKLQHVKFARILGLEPARKDRGPILVSSHVAGTRLIDVLEMASHGLVTFDAGAGLLVTREVLGALAVLHDSRNVAHGALAPERIVLTASGRVVMVEHVLAQALDRLQRPRHQLWREWKIPTPPAAGPVRFDTQTDLAQAGLLALAVLLGRPVDEEEYPHRLRGLLPLVQDRLAHSKAKGVAGDVVAWLERLMPVDSRRAFKSVREAQQAYEGLVSTGASAMGVTTARLKSVMAAIAEMGATAAKPAPEPPADALPETPAVVVNAQAPAAVASPAAPIDIDIEALLRLEAELEGEATLPAEAPRMPAPVAAIVPVPAAPALDALHSERADLEKQFADLVQSVAPAEDPPVHLIPEVPAESEPLVHAHVLWSSMPASDADESLAPSSGALSDEQAEPVFEEPLPWERDATPDVVVETAEDVVESPFFGEPIVIGSSSEPVPAAAMEHVPAEWWKEALPWRDGEAAGAEVDDAHAQAIEPDVVHLAGEEETLETVADPVVPLEALPSPVGEIADVVEIAAVVDELAVVVEAVGDGLGDPVTEHLADAIAFDPVADVDHLAEAPAEEPASDALTAAEPAAGEPAAEEPSAEDTAAEDPAASDAADVNTEAARWDDEPAPQDWPLEPLSETDNAAPPLAAAPIAWGEVSGDMAPAAEAPLFADASAHAEVFEQAVPFAEPVSGESGGLFGLRMPVAFGVDDSDVPEADDAQVAGIADAASVNAAAALLARDDAAEPVADWRSSLLGNDSAASDDWGWATALSATGPDPQVAPQDAPVLANIATDDATSAVVDEPPVPVFEPAAWAEPSTTLDAADPIESAVELSIPSGEALPLVVEAAAVEPAIEVAIEPVLVDADILAQDDIDDRVLVVDEPLVAAPEPVEEVADVAIIGVDEAEIQAVATVDLEDIVVAVEAEPVDDAAPMVDAIGDAVRETPGALAEVGADAGDIVPAAAPEPAADADPVVTNPATRDAVPEVVIVDDGKDEEAWDHLPSEAPAVDAVDNGDPDVIQAPTAVGSKRRRRRARRKKGGLPEAPPMPAPAPIVVEAPAVSPLESDVFEPVAVPDAIDEPAAADMPSPAPARHEGEPPVAAPRGRSLLERVVPSWTPPVDLTPLRAQPVRVTAPEPNADAMPAASLAGEPTHEVAAFQAPRPLVEAPVVAAPMAAPNAAPVVSTLSAGIDAAWIEPEIKAVGLPDPEVLEPRGGRTSSLTSHGDGYGSGAAGLRSPGVETTWQPAPVDVPGRSGGVNWRRLIAASVLVALFQGAAFAAWWWVAPGARGTLVVQTSKMGVEVLLDDKVVGRTPLREEVPPGRHRLRLRQGTNVREMPVEISAGVVTTQSIEWPVSAGGLGSLQVTSDPAGAEIFIGGKSQGKAPRLIEELPSGEHLLTLRSAAGSVTVKGMVVADATTPLEVKIFAGWIVVDAPVELSLLLNGRARLGSSMDGQILLPPGPHRVLATNDALGIRQWLTVTVEPGAVTRVPFRVAAGTLTMQDAAEVIVDGVPAGTMPGSISIQPGTHDVLIRRADGTERRQAITVRAGQRIEF